MGRDDRRDHRKRGRSRSPERRPTDRSRKPREKEIFKIPEKLSSEEKIKYILKGGAQVPVNPALLEENEVKLSTVQKPILKAIFFMFLERYPSLARRNHRS
jgi:hypothetical protein